MASRREFLSGLTAAGAAGITWPQSLAAAETKPASDKHGTLLPTRPFGKTGDRVTLLGFGGQHYRRLQGDDRIKAIEIAIEGGVRFFDTAESYGRESQSERLYGEFLTPKYRDEVFLMTKSAARNPKTARQHLEKSLRNLKTDVIDLWQVHTLETIADVDKRWDNGTVEVFLKAQEEGKVRHIGFTGHKQPEVHLHFLERALAEGVSFQSSQFPVNVCDPAFSSFIEKVIPRCLENDIAVLAMKTLCGGKLFDSLGEAWGPRGKVTTKPLVPDQLPFRDATDYVWSLPVATRITGFDNLQQLTENIEAAKNVRNLTPEQCNAILATASEEAGPDREFYKRNVLALDKPDESRF
ncbi:MAG: aldo/keto reductase [Verrucomicrobiota bacterium JB023]|nr:aldo/keto reductase [Verrucomicrobiota bacterium JB023]